MITQPNLILYPFAKDGDFVNPPIDGLNTSNFVSQKYGFPETMSEDVNVPRNQLNGVFNLYSQVIVFLNKGGFYTFDPLFIDGYQQGAVLFYYSTDYKGFLISNINSNTNNFILYPAFIGDNTKPWSKITSFLPDITDVNGEIGFNGNTTTTGNAVFNQIINAVNANFTNRPFITSLPSNDYFDNQGVLVGKTNQVAVLGDLNTVMNANASIDQGFGGSITDTGYNSNSFPGLNDGGSIGKWASFDAVFTEWSNSAVCQIITKCESFKANNGYDTLAGRVYNITNASQYLTSFGLTFGEFFPLSQTFLSSSGVSVTYNGNDVILSVNGGGCETLRKTYLSFVSVVVSPKINLKRNLSAIITSDLKADLLMINKDNNLNEINYVNNKNMYKYDVIKDESTLISSVENYDNLGLINNIENGTIKIDKKLTKKQFKEIKTRLVNNEKFDLWGQYLQ